MRFPSWPLVITRFNQRSMLVYSILLLLAWMGVFLRGLFPFFANSILTDLVLFGAAALPLAAIIIAMLCSLGHRTSYTNRTPLTVRLVILSLLSAVGTVLYFLGYPLQLGTRLGGKLGIGTQPVLDLQKSAAVARLAASGEYGWLPPEEWPESVKEWNVRVRSIEVIPRGASSPEIMVNIGGRGARIHGIHVLNSPPVDNEFDVYTHWTENMWLTRRLGGD